jgi:hypothetical protein
LTAVTKVRTWTGRSRTSCPCRARQASVPCCVTTMSKRRLLVPRTIDQLVVADEGSFRHVPLYRDLKKVLSLARYSFRVMREPRYQRALLLNLTFWSAEQGGDVQPTEQLAADVVMHAAWHHLAASALARPAHSLSADAMLLGESIASAFDAYLVGCLLRHAPRSSFLRTQVPSMSDAAHDAGMTAREFATMLQQMVDSPERAFVDLRALLFDAATALLASKDAAAACRALDKLDRRRFAPLLHHYELSNWVLYARAYGASRVHPMVASIDRSLRDAEAIAWLQRHWVEPAIA